jgi:hypothetical protein
LHHRGAMTMSGWDWRRFGSWGIISGQPACTLISLVFVFLFRDDAMVGVRFRREISSAFALI